MKNRINQKNTQKWRKEKRENQIKRKEKGNQNSRQTYVQEGMEEQKGK